MSDRIDADLREKTAPGGVAGILASLVQWVKDHVPLVVKPAEYADKRIDQERARTRILDAQARILEADARRRELENEEFSARSAAIAQQLSARLLTSEGQVQQDALSLDEAGVALRAAAEQLRALGIDVQLTLRTVTPAELKPGLPKDQLALPVEVRDRSVEGE